MPEITVLLPVRNGARTIHEAVESVCRQTFGDFELLVLDDGSTDRTLPIVSSIADARIRLVPAVGAPGLVARLNQGIAMAQGRFIARMDADDLCFPDRFRIQRDALLQDQTVDLIGCRTLIFDDTRGPIGLLPFRESHEQLCEAPWLGIYLPHPSWFGRTSWFRTHRYKVPEVVRAEDQELLLRAMPTSRYRALSDVMLAYRVYRQSLGKLWTARTQLLKAQQALFWQRRQHVWQAAALTAFGGRVAYDLMRTATAPAVATTPFTVDLEPTLIERFRALREERPQAS